MSRTLDEKLTPRRESFAQGRDADFVLRLPVNFYCDHILTFWNGFDVEEPLFAKLFAFDTS